MFREASKHDPMIAKLMADIAAKGTMTTIENETLRNRLTKAMEKAALEKDNTYLTGRVYAHDDNPVLEISFDHHGSLREYIKSAVAGNVPRGKIKRTIQERYGSISKQEIDRLIYYAERKLKERSKKLTKSRMSKSKIKLSEDSFEPGELEDMIDELNKLGSSIPSRIYNKFVNLEYPSKQEMRRYLDRMKDELFHPVDPRVVKAIKEYPRAFNKTIREDLLRGKYQEDHALSIVSGLINEYLKKEIES
jgi:hypothetical protein